MSIWTRNFILLCLTNLALFVSMHILGPTLPLYLLKIGGSQKDVGYIMAAYTIGAMIARPPAGWLVDRFSRKKVLLFGMFLMLLVSLLYRLTADPSLMILVRGLHGITFGIASTAVGTMVADNLPPEHLGEGMGYFGLTASLSLAIAPIIGFGLIEKFSYPMLFVMVIILTGLAFCSSLTVKGTTVPTNPQKRPKTGFIDGILEKTALLPSEIMFFLAVTYGAVISFISLYGMELGISNIGSFFTSMALGMLVTRPIAGRWADKSGPDMVLLIGHLALFIGMGAIALSHTIIGLILAGAAVGTGFGFCSPILQALSVQHAPTHRRGVATATYFISMDLGIGLGTIIWGYVAEAAGFQIMYFTTLIPIALAGAIYLKSRNTRPTEMIELESKISGI